MNLRKERGGLRLWLGLVVAFGSLMVATALPVRAQTADDDTVEAALDMIRNRKVDQGVFMLQRLAGQGNADSLFHIGELFRLGVGRDKAPDIAVMHYRLAAALNHERASLSLANMLFFEGDGSEKTIAEALSVWQTLAMEGNQESLYMLGMIYWNGDSGIEIDPVRGYGLVWKAAQLGYADAEQNELAMRSMLNAEARTAAMEYADDLVQAGFGEERLAENLLFAQNVEEAEADDGTAVSDGDQLVSTDVAVPSENMEEVEEAGEVEPEPEEVEEPLVRPDDWTTVWRLEVGHAMSERELSRLQSIILGEADTELGELFSDMEASAARPGLFRLIYGPMRGMIHAVNTCVTLKRKGFECQTKAPD